MSNRPGARWWKFDFHTHTPCSSDYGKHSPDQANLRKLPPRDWLLAYMRAGIDCVAITDHNSGEWIDTLHEALEKLEIDQPEGFRELTIFPGAEITSNSDVHMLTIFEPDTSKTHVDELLGAVRLQGQRGEGTAVEASSIDVAQHVGRLGGLTILAHVDGPNGANTKEGGNNSLSKLIATNSINGLEVCDTTTALKPALRESGLPRVLGSDCHHPDGSTGPKCPGSHFTWIKMGAPTLEGLRLALIDGDGASVIRSDAMDVDVDPNATPADWIESIEVHKAKVMGNGAPAVLSFNPSLNAIVGGRGTGKSTVVHLLRASLHRVDEIRRLSENAEPRLDVERFLRSYESRKDPGGLKEDSEARVVFHHAGKRFRITWREKQTRVEEDSASSWMPAPTQAVRDRFPVQIFSQGQILELTGRNSAALLEFIDDASGAAALKKRVEEEHSRFMTLRARGRELTQKAANLDSVRGQLEDVQHKLSALEHSQHSAVLREHQRRNRQLRELEVARDDARGQAARIRDLAADLSLAEMPPELFDASDVVEAGVSAAYEQLREAIDSAAADLLRSGTAIEQAEERFTTQAIDGAIHPAAAASRARYDALVEALRADGVSDPNQFGILVQDRQRLETESKNLVSAEQRALEVATEANTVLATIFELRHSLWQHRQDWVETTLRGNSFVRISVEPFGDDPEMAERSFRDLIGVTDERFASDIFERDKRTGKVTGLVVDLFRGASSSVGDRCNDVNARLSALRKAIESGGSFGGYFNNFLAKTREKRPELMDRIDLWSPEDGVRIEYSPKGDGKEFRPISQGSAGQRSAAVLAFFLAYGDEPLVLDQPEDDLDNHLIYDLIVQQLRESKKRRQVIVVTHNANVVVNGYAELVFVMDFKGGQCVVDRVGCLQDSDIREEVFKVMEGGRDAFLKRFRRLDGGRSV